MGFEKEFASYEPLRRILESEKVQSLQRRLKIRNDGNHEEWKGELDSHIAKRSDYASDFTPEFIISIDGSYQCTPIQNGFPGAEFGYITTSAVLILDNKVRDIAKSEFIDPKQFRETEKAKTLESIIPGCNVILDAEKDAKASMRKALFETLSENRAFEDGETLIETYEHLLSIKISHDANNSVSRPKSPIDGIDDPMTYGMGIYKCPITGEQLYSTDALRLHELLVTTGASGELYGQCMSMLEKLWLINILRSFENRKWLDLLDRVVFILDGPLACFSTWSWLNKSIITELDRINTAQKDYTSRDLLIIGIEKSGTFFNHFEMIDTGENKESDMFPHQSALLLDDQYIKKNIIFSLSGTQYGKDVYFGRKLFYKTKSGYRIVANVVTLDKYQRDLETALASQYARLSDLMKFLDDSVSSRYPNSLSPLVSAHAEAAIPLNIGGKIFEEIAREIKSRGKPL